MNNLYKPYARGGAEKVMETIADGLIQAGHEVFIIATKPRREAKSVDGGLRAYYLNSFYYNLNKLPKFLRFFWQIWNIFNFINYFKVKKILKAEKCDAVITNNLMGLGLLVPRAIRKLKIKHLHLAHDIQLVHPSGLIYFGKEKLINSLETKIYSSFCRLVFGSPDAIISPSRWLLEKHLDAKFFPKAKKIAMHNPAAVADLIKPEKKNGIFTFLFVGQIEKHKGALLMVEAFKKIKAGLAELVIAGDGVELEQTKAAAGPGVKFLGRVSQEKVSELLFKVDCLIYPSLTYENCPDVIERALASGLPVIGSDLGGTSELLAGGAGILFKPADADDLAEKMQWVIENKNNLTQIIKAGEEKAKEFKVENYIKELEELI